MGNEMGVLGDGTAKASLPELSNVFTPPRLKSFGSMSKILSSQSTPADKGPEGAPDASPGPAEKARKAIKRLKKHGVVSVGDTFTTWRSSQVTEPSYLQGKIVAVNREGLKTRSVVIEYRTEVDIASLQSSVSRAQQALGVEQQWKDKLGALGLTPGTKAELWVPADHKPIVTVAQRRRSTLKTNLKTPARAGRRRRVGSSRVLTPEPEATSLAEAAERGEPTNEDGQADSIGGEAQTEGDENDDGAQSPIPDADALLAANPDDPTSGGIHTYTLLQVDVRWHFKEAVVDLQLARNLSDGTLAQPEALPYNTVRGMLENGNIAKSVLKEELALIKEHEGIMIGAKVDMWVEELNTNVRGVVTEINHSFKDMETCELKPVVKYFVDGEKRFLHFDDYVGFVTSWKQAKYVTEQQLTLTQRAFEMGVQVGRKISVFQSAHSPRWTFKEGGSLEAVVADLQFDFDPEKYTVSMSVLLQYTERGGSNYKTDRRVTVSSDDDRDVVEELVAWEDLQLRLRAQITISDISCQNLLEFGAADPYVKMVVGGSKRKTTVAEASVSPSWPDDTFVFREGEDSNRHNKRGSRPRSSSAAGFSFLEQDLQLMVYDGARGSKHHFLGMAVVPLSSLIPAGTHDVALELGPMKVEKAKKNVVYGNISLFVQGRGPGITYAKSKLHHRTSSNQEYRQRKQDGKDLFFEAFQ